MAIPRSMFAMILVLALLGVASAGAEYRKGRSLKPYGASSSTGSEQESSDTKIRGIIACKKNGQFIPMAGALARITCLLLNDHGYESSPMSVITEPTNKDGYFETKVPAGSFRLKGCRVFLEGPAPGSCNTPTDINNGLSGAPLRVFKPVGPHSFLYTVGPFIFLPSEY